MVLLGGAGALLAAAALFYATTPKPNPVLIAPETAPRAAESAQPEQAGEGKRDEKLEVMEREFREREIESAEPLDDQPAEQTPLALPVPSASAPAANETAAELKRRAEEALSRVSVRMYTTSWCPACRQARAWLSANDIRYQDFDVERDAAARQRLLRLNPKGSVPTIEVDERVHVGFGPATLGQSIAQAIERRMASP